MPGGVRGSGGDPAAYSMDAEMFVRNAGYEGGCLLLNMATGTFGWRFVFVSLVAFFT